MNSAECFKMTAMLTYRKTIRPVKIEVCPGTKTSYTYTLFSKDRKSVFLFTKNNENHWIQIEGATFTEEALAAIHNMLMEIDNDLLSQGNAIH